MRPSAQTGALLLLAIAIMTPSFLFGPQTVDSGQYNYIWTKQIAEGFAAGQIYPRWLPDSFLGYGSPALFFYPPLAIFVSGLLDAVGLTSLQAINVAGLLFLVASGMTMRLWLRSIGAVWWGALIYMAAPYHLFDFYARGALAEFAAFSWIPLIALGITARAWWAPPLLAASYAALVLTHLPVALLASVFLIPLLVFKAWNGEWKFLVSRGTAGLIGLAISAIYLLPALTLQSQIAADQLWTPLFRPQNHFVFSPDPLVAGIVFVLAIVGGLYVLLTAYEALKRPPVRFWALTTLGLVLFSTGVLGIVWSIPVLEKVQMPWRIMTLVEFAAITALCLPPARKVWGWLIGVLGAVTVIGFMMQWPPQGRAEFKAEIDRHLWDATEYLPSTFDTSGMSPSYRPADLSSVPAPTRRIADGATWAQATSEEVVLDRFAFPIWRVYRNGEPVDLHGGPVISFTAPVGDYEIRRAVLPQERWGGWISLIGLLGLGGLVLASRRRPTAV
jgi:hypothetical protein